MTVQHQQPKEEVTDEERQALQGKGVLTPRRDLPILQLRVTGRQPSEESQGKHLPNKRQQTMQVNVLLDTGSSVNLVAVRCAKTLNLPVVAQKRISIGIDINILNILITIFM